MVFPLLGFTLMPPMTTTTVITTTTPTTTPKPTPPPQPKPRKLGNYFVYRVNLTSIHDLTIITSYLLKTGLWWSLMFLEKSQVPSFGVIVPGLTKPICFDLPMVSSKTYTIMKLTPATAGNVIPKNWYSHNYHIH